MEIGKEFLWASVGTILGLLLGAFLTFLTTKQILKQQKEIWIREKLLEIYSSCIYYLVKLAISANVKSPKDDKDVRQHFAECQRYLNLLQAYQTSEDAKPLDACKKNLADNWDKTTQLADKADEAIGDVKRLFEKDKRIRSELITNNISVLSQRYSNEFSDLQKSLSCSLKFFSENACKSGIFSNKLTLKICSIV